MAIDAAVDDDPAADDRFVAAGLREPSRMQRDLERARYIEDLEPVGRQLPFLELGADRVDRAADDLAVPAGRDDRDARRPRIVRPQARVRGFEGFLVELESLI